MKSTSLIAVLVILVASLSVSQFALAQSSQNSYTVNMTYLTVQLSYPSEVLPGDSVTVGVQATAKSAIDSVTLTAQVFYSDGVNLNQLTSTTLSSNSYMNSGGSLSKQIQFTVPQNVPRTSLVAVWTEKVRTVYASYYYYPVYKNYSSPYCYYYYDPYYGYYCYYNYVYYPTYSYSTTTDSGVSPLSYVKATTPEYVSLQSQYQNLQSQYQAVQQQLAQSQAQNLQLGQNLQNAQNTIAQRDATIAGLNQQLSSTQTTNVTLEAIAGGLAIVAIVFGIIAVHEHRGKGNPPPKAKGQTETKS